MAVCQTGTLVFNSQKSMELTFSYKWNQVVYDWRLGNVDSHCKYPISIDEDHCEWMRILTPFYNKSSLQEAGLQHYTTCASNRVSLTYALLGMFGNLII